MQPNDDQNQQSDLKTKILEELAPLANQIKDSSERFYVLISLLREKWSDDLANQLYETAKTIEDPQKKARCLQDILFEINYRKNH